MSNKPISTLKSLAFLRKSHNATTPIPVQDLLVALSDSARDVEQIKHIGGREECHYELCPRRSEIDITHKVKLISVSLSTRQSPLMPIEWKRLLLLPSQCCLYVDDDANCKLAVQFMREKATQRTLKIKKDDMAFKCSNLKLVSWSLIPTAFYIFVNSFVYQAKMSYLSAAGFWSVMSVVTALFCLVAITTFWAVDKAVENDVNGVLNMCYYSLFGFLMMCLVMTWPLKVGILELNEEGIDRKTVLALVVLTGFSIVGSLVGMLSTARKITLVRNAVGNLENLEE